MRQFNSLQELWDCCEICRLCQNKMTIKVGTGPSAVFHINTHLKKDNELLLDCLFQNRIQNCVIKYNINCLENTFTYSIEDVPQQSAIETNKRVNSPFLYFWVSGQCSYCQSEIREAPPISAVSSADIELNLLEKKISVIKLASEHYHLKEGFAISIWHDSDYILVSNDLDTSKAIRLPMMELDLSDEDKLISKVKTLILFV